MKKLILLFTLLILASCSEDSLNPSDYEQDSGIQPALKCVFGRYVDGQLVGSGVHNLTTADIDGKVADLGDGIEHRFKCYDASRYTTLEMRSMLIRYYN